MNFAQFITDSKALRITLLLIFGAVIGTFANPVSAQSISVTGAINPNWPATVGIASSLTASGSGSSPTENSTPSWSFSVSVTMCTTQGGTYSAATAGTDYNVTAFSGGGAASQSATITFLHADFYEVTFNGSVTGGSASGSASTTVGAYAVDLNVTVTGSSAFERGLNPPGEYTTSVTGGTAPYFDLGWLCDSQDPTFTLVVWDPTSSSSGDGWAEIYSSTAVTGSIKSLVQEQVKDSSTPPKVGDGGMISYAKP